MNECSHRWRMVDISFGFTVFEKCSHCQGVRTYFSPQDTWDEYTEGQCTWSIVENAQSFRFNLQCIKCSFLEKYDDLLGLLYCTSCLDDCPIERLRRDYEKEKTSILVAFGFLPEALKHPLSPKKLDILTDFFNQRRDTSRSKIKIIPFNLIDKISMCKGEFIHDVGMTSLERPGERAQLL